jgi:hypothetical protein
LRRFIEYSHNCSRRIAFDTCGRVQRADLPRAFGRRQRSKQAGTAHAPSRRQAVHRLLALAGLFARANVIPEPSIVDTASIHPRGGSTMSSTQLLLFTESHLRRWPRCARHSHSRVQACEIHGDRVIRSASSGPTAAAVAPTVAPPDINIPLSRRLSERQYGPRARPSRPPERQYSPHARPLERQSGLSTAGFGRSLSLSRARAQNATPRAIHRRYRLGPPKPEVVSP